MFVSVVFCCCFFCAFVCVFFVVVVVVFLWGDMYSHVNFLKCTFIWRLISG